MECIQASPHVHTRLQVDSPLRVVQDKGPRGDILRAVEAWVLAQLLRGHLLPHCLDEVLAADAVLVGLEHIRQRKRQGSVGRAGVTGVRIGICARLVELAARHQHDALLISTGSGGSRIGSGLRIWDSREDGTSLSGEGNQHQT